MNLPIKQFAAMLLLSTSLSIPALAQDGESRNKSPRKFHSDYVDTSDPDGAILKSDPDRKFYSDYTNGKPEQEGQAKDNPTRKFHSDWYDEEAPQAHQGTSRSTMSNEESPKPYSQLEVYPNPADNEFNIRVNDLNAEAELIVTDLLGKVVHQEQLMPGQQEVKVQAYDYPTGIYLVSVISGAERQTLKIHIK